MMQKRILLFCTLFLCFGGVRADIFGDLLDFVFGGFGGGSNPPSRTPSPPPSVDPGSGGRPVAVPAEYAYSPTGEYEYEDTLIPTPVGYPPPEQTPLPKPVLLPSPPPSPILLASPPPPSPVQSRPPPPPVVDITPDAMKPQENPPTVPRLPPPANENYPPPVATVLIPDRQQGSSSSTTATTNNGMSTTTKIIIAVSCSVGGIIAIAIIIVMCCYCGQKRKVKHSPGNETDLESGRRTSNTSRRSSNKSRSRNTYKMNSFDPFMNEKNLPEVVRLENAGLQVAATGLEHTSSMISRSDILKNGPVWKSNQTQSEVLSNAVGPMAAAAAAATTVSSRAMSHQSTRKKRSLDALSRDQMTENNTVSQWLGISKAEERSELTPNDSKASLVSSYDIDFSSMELDVPVGRGSFGTIYKALWNETLVAVKFLTSAVDEETCDPGNPNGGQIVSLLESEGEILASLRHPNIVQFIGVCSQPPCIISEYVDKGSLSDLIRNSRASKDISWGMLLKMLADAATGMLYLHARPSPIIHCDLKSNNILVDTYFRTKICDFNLSRLLEQSTSSLLSSVQNPRWIAPEVLDGERYSKESDVYSFGIVMWEVLTRKIPWHGVDMGEIVTLVREGARPEIPNFWDVQDGRGEEFIVFEEYVDLMTSCWSQNPYDRPSFATIIKVLRDMILLSGQQPIPDLKKNAPEIPDQAMLTNESTRAMTDSMPHRRDI